MLRDTVRYCIPRAQQPAEQATTSEIRIEGPTARRYRKRCRVSPPSVDHAGIQLEALTRLLREFDIFDLDLSIERSQFHRDNSEPKSLLIWPECDCEAEEVSAVVW